MYTTPFITAMKTAAYLSNYRSWPYSLYCGSHHEYTEDTKHYKIIGYYFMTKMPLELLRYFCMH